MTGTPESPRVQKRCMHRECCPHPQEGSITSYTFYMMPCLLCDGNARIHSNPDIACAPSLGGLLLFSFLFLCSFCLCVSCSSDVTVTSVSLPSSVSHRGLFNTNYRLSLKHLGLDAKGQGKVQKVRGAVTETGCLP